MTSPLGTPRPPKFDSCVPKSPEDRLARLISAFAGATKTISKIQRWTLDSTEPRQNEANYGVSNRAILIGELAAAKEAISAVEADLLEGMIGLRVSNAAAVESMLKEYAQKREPHGAEAVLNLMRRYGVSDVCELVKPELFDRLRAELQPEVTSAGVDGVHFAPSYPGFIERERTTTAHHPAFSAPYDLSELPSAPYNEDNVIPLMSMLHKELGSTGVANAMRGAQWSQIMPSSRVLNRGVVDQWCRRAVKMLADHRRAEAEAQLRREEIERGEGVDYGL